MDDILISGEVEETLKKEIPECAETFNVVSGFCKLETLMFLDSLCRKGIRKRLLVRFLPSDIASGSTDKEIYSFCKENGWAIYIDYTIHAKTYVFDKVKCIIGSANATGKGLGLASNCNKEASAYFRLDEDQYCKVMTLYKDAVLLDDDLYDLIVSQVDDEEVIKTITAQKLTLKSVECLMAEDFPDENSDIVELHNSKAYNWLVQYLTSKEEHFAYFGELSSAIHDIFIKEPKPYRKDIKYYFANLLENIKKNHDSLIKITRPNYSERVSLAK